jgi:hypothetical protein
MKPEDAEAWLPVVRDYLTLLIGIGLGFYGIYARNITMTTLGFGLAGIGSVSRAYQASKRSE